MYKQPTFETLFFKILKWNDFSYLAFPFERLPEVMTETTLTSLHKTPQCHYCTVYSVHYTMGSV